MLTRVLEGDSHLWRAHRARVIRVVLLVDGLQTDRRTDAQQNPQLTAHRHIFSSHSSHQVSLHLLPQRGELSEAELRVSAVLWSS